MGKLKSIVDRISTRLVAVLLIPVLATSAMAGIFAYGLHEEAEAFADIRSDTETLVSLNQLRTQMAIERTVTFGSVAIVNLEAQTGIDVASMARDSQFNMVASMASSRELVDDLIADLPVASLTESDGAADGRQALRDLVANRQAIDANLLSATSLTENYDRYIGAIDRWIDDVDADLSLYTTEAKQSREVVETLDRLQTLTAVVDEDLRIVVPLLSAAVVAPPSGADDRLIGNRAVAAGLTQELNKSMPQALQADWQQFLRDTSTADAAGARIIEAVRAADPDEPIDLGLLFVVGADLQPTVDRLELLADFQSNVGALLISEAAADESTANADFVRLMVLGTALLLLTLVSATIVARHLARSMRQLGNAAEAIHTGEFDASNLPTKGPREVVDTARAFSTMTDTLRAVDAHATAIATGGSSSVEMLSSVQGHIGESLRSSLLRVETMAEQLRHEANHDSLTGLANRAGVIERLETLLSSGPQTLITTMFIDLDRFKRVNDTFGHNIGDALLTAAGFRLRHGAGEHRTVARLGGDEFLLVADDLPDEAAALELANRLAQELDEQFSIEDRVLRISASFGVSQELANGQTVADILRNADMAAYEAKRHRSQSVVFSNDELLETAVESMKLEEALRGSWARGEMSLYLQPLVSPNDGKPASAEALMRWTRPDGSMVPPDVFIPIAEETGMIVAIDEWMVNQAARQISLWEKIGHAAGALRIAVNISGQHFTEGDLVGTVVAACADNDIQPEQLVIEVTESCAVGDILHTVAVLKELRELGVKISLDDFGTGYSSLSYLQQLPIDTVKIDRSFIKGLPYVDANAKIVELVATLSSVLELAVVAEGVETSDQADCLEDLGIQFLQGYYFAKPMEAAAFGHWVEKLDHNDPFTHTALV